MAKDDADEDGSVDSTLSDPFMWSRDLEKHSYGEFSFAVVQSNEVIEDHSQVETSNEATFVGVYDGHGGVEASRYICEHLFKHLLSEISSLLNPLLDFDSMKFSKILILL